VARLHVRCACQQIVLTRAAPALMMCCPHASWARHQAQRSAAQPARCQATSACMAYPTYVLRTSAHCHHTCACMCVYGCREARGANTSREGRHPLWRTCTCAGRHAAGSALGPATIRQRRHRFVSMRMRARTALCARRAHIVCACACKRALCRVHVVCMCMHTCLRVLGEKCPPCVLVVACSVQQAGACA